MNDRRDYYQILQIAPQADPAIIKAAYYTHLKSLKKHPDLGGSHNDAVLLNEAYEILGDPYRRREYDREFVDGLVSDSSAPQKNPFEPVESLRQFPRTVFYNRFRIRNHTAEKWIDAQFRDISLGGACFRSREKFGTGEILDLDISEDFNLRPTAKICWGRLLPQRFGIPLFEGGLEFQRINQEQFRDFLKTVGLRHVL
ncbi:MAG: J domain-containing protein [Deltaproteobacteria bacterium]|nr:J domain-containing protein [Deltaproteobacteria bacterium]